MIARRSLLVVVLAAALLVAIPSVAEASVIPLSIAEMTELADTVVEVRVTGTGARWTHDPMTRERQAIVTDVRVHVTRVLKGSPRADLVFTQFGGTVGSDALAVSGLPDFSAGERCILFLDETGVIGGSQGKLSIEDGRVPSLGLPVAAAEAAIAAGGDVVSLAEISPQAVTVFESTFEGGSTAGWTMTGTPTWASTSYRAQAGSYSLYGSGGGSGSVPPPGPCPQAVTAYATRTMNLSAYNVATLEWDVWTGMTVNAYNWMNVALATSASGPWYYPKTSFAQGAPGAWRHYSVDLQSVTDQFGEGTLDFTGRSTVYVRLVFFHGDGTTDEGAYVDNVRVTAASMIRPVISSVSPGSANAGVGDIVTISGTDFGAVQGSGNVAFLVGNMQDGSRVEAPIVSWSDTRIVCEVPRLAESGTIRVRADTGAMGYSAEYSVGFSDSGMRWAAPAVSYRINENTTDLVGEANAIRRAFATWSGCGAAFDLVYGGITTVSSYPPNTMNGINEIYFVSGALPTGVLGANFTRFIGSIRKESDIVFNDDYFWADGAVAGRYDVETIALHELGHTVGLDDQYGDQDEAMGAGLVNSTRRVPSAADVAGAIYIWGARPDESLPSAPVIESSTHPSQSSWYADPDPEFVFSATDPVGIAGYSYLLDASPTTVPDEVVDCATGPAAITGLGDGEWYFHVRAVDSAGNWGPASHYKVCIDTSEPLVVVQVAGATRFDTGVEASKLAYPSGADTVIIATGRNWPDALGGAALAGAVGGPILLSDTAALPDSVKLELTRLGATHAIILGGTGALDIGVEEDLTAAGLTFERLAGADRYATARAIAAETIARGGEYDGTAFVSTGRDFPDALAASPIAAAKGWPVFLADPSADPDVLAGAMQGLGVSDVLILGGEGVVSAGYESAFISAFGSATRLAGIDRYATCATVAQYGVDHAGLSFNGLAMGVGNNFPDALAGGPLCAQFGSVMLLTDPNTLSARTAEVLAEQRLSIDSVYFLGGVGAVTQPVRDQVVALLD